MDPATTRSHSLPITLDRASHASLQRQLSNAIKALVREGRLCGGTLLPSSRTLAEELRVSRNTVTAAYDRLIGEGYLAAHARSGVRVHPALPVLLPATRSPQRRPTAKTIVRDEPASLEPPAPFRPCQPDVRLFPLDLWNRRRSGCLHASGTALLHYQSGHPLGLPALRQALARYLAESRGVRCHWQQIAVTTGSQQALYLVAEATLTADSRVLMEDPGYPGAWQAWEHRGARVDSVGVDHDGALVPDDAAEQAIDLVYLTPSRQHPTGACLPVARRLQWLDLVARRGAWLVEDDYDSEIRFGRPPLPSVHGLDSAGRVVYVGSMSKVLFPSLRIGYLVLPDALVDRVAALRSVMDNHGPLIDQATLAAFIDGGGFSRHLRRCRRIYGERQAEFLEQAQRAHLPVEFAETDGGMSLLGRLPDDGVDDARLSATLAAKGFDVPALSSYRRNQPASGLVFGYTAFDHDELARHVARLGRLMPRAIAAARKRADHPPSS